MAARWVVLNADEMSERMRRVNGVGGIENFVRRLQKKARPATGEVRLDDKDLDDLAHYRLRLRAGRLRGSTREGVRAGARASSRTRGAGRRSARMNAKGGELIVADPALFSPTRPHRDHCT